MRAPRVRRRASRSARVAATSRDGDGAATKASSAGRTAARAVGRQRRPGAQRQRRERAAEPGGVAHRLDTLRIGTSSTSMRRLRRRSASLRLGVRGW